MSKEHDQITLISKNIGGLHYTTTSHWSSLLGLYFGITYEITDKAGEFTVLQKAKTALIDNAIYYGTYILIFVILLVYIAISTQYNLSFQNLKLIGISAANTWGLFLLGKLYIYNRTLFMICSVITWIWSG